jgi:CRP-like cAMP-binding protein
MNLYTEYSPTEINVFKSLSSNTSSLANSKLLEISKHIKILHSIPKNVLNKILKDVKIFKYKKNETIIKEGDYGDTIFYILKGNVSIKKQENSIAVLGQEHIFGEMAGILNKPRSASVVAIENNTTIISFKINFNLLDSELSYYFAIIFKNLAEELAEKLSNDDTKLINDEL